MPTKHDRLMGVFQRVISREDSVVKAIHNYGESLRLSAVSWQFTLPDCIPHPYIENSKTPLVFAPRQLFS